MENSFYGVNVNRMLNIRGKRGCGVSIAIARGDDAQTFCAGSGRLGKDFPVESDMLFQAGSVSKPVFAATLLRFVDKGIIDLDADLSGVIPDFADSPLTFSALLSHTAGFNVHGFDGYPAKHAPLSLGDVLSGRGNSPRVCRTMPYGKQYSYSGGGVTLAELAFTRITGMPLRDAFAREIAAPLRLRRSGYFQPLDEDKIENAAFGGLLGIREDRRNGYHYYPERAAAGLWTTPTELTRIGIALSRSFREGGLLEKRTAERMMNPVMGGCGLCIFRKEQMPDAASHGGWNEGFLTQWIFSLTKDLCVAAMINRADRNTCKRFEDAASALFQSADGSSAAPGHSGDSGPQGCR